MPDFDRLRRKRVQCTLNNMTKPSKSARSALPALKQAVVYVRVSSKEQEKEGFSIPAQQKLLKDYASSNGFAITHEYVDVETAKQAGRAAFGEMIGEKSPVPHNQSECQLLRHVEVLCQSASVVLGAEEIERQSVP